MSSLWKTRLLKYGSCAAVVAVFVTAYVRAKADTALTQADWYLVLCDAFTVPGILLTMLGCLIWASSQGAMDGLAYCIRWAVFSLIPGKRLARDETYGDYVERKRENRTKGYGFLFYSGLLTIAVAIVFMVLFYQVYNK